MPPAKLPVTPAGKPETVAPVPPFATVYVILVIAVFIQSACVFVAAAELSVVVAFGFTMIVPLKEATPTPPDVVTV